MRCHNLTLLAVFAAALTVAATGQVPRSGSTRRSGRVRGRHRELTGWADWERAHTLLARIKVPPAPPLDPEAALKTFRVAPGYRVELVAAEPMVRRPDLLRIRSRRPHLGGRVPGLHARPAGHRRRRSDLPRRRARRHRRRRPGRPQHGVSRSAGDAAIVRLRSGRHPPAGAAEAVVVSRTPMAICGATEDTKSALTASPAIRSTPPTACGTASTTGCTAPTSPSGTASPATALIEEDTIHPRPVRRHLRRDGTVLDVRENCALHRRLYPGRVHARATRARQVVRRGAGRVRARSASTSTWPWTKRGGRVSRPGHPGCHARARSSCARMDGCAPTPSRPASASTTGISSLPMPRQCLRSGIGRSSRRSPEARRRHRPASHALLSR